MLKQAMSELRLHPARFVATLIAIAISVGFISAISVFINSQQDAMGRQAALPIATADVVVNLDGAQANQRLVDKVQGVAGVDSVGPVPPKVSLFVSKGADSLTADFYPTPTEALRWSKLIDGRFPTSDAEVTLAQAGAATLGVGVGDQVELQNSVRATVVGITDDPKTMFAVVGYLAPQSDALDGASQLSVRIKNGADPEQVASAVGAVLPDGAKAATGEATRSDLLAGVTAGFNVFKYLLQGFAAIALLVGMITIANTFTILVAQRRRQLALLRAIGATPGQVTGKLIVESFLLGAVGSFLGIGVGFLVAWIGGQVTGSNYFGLTVVWTELAIAWGVGVLATMASAVLPAVRAARVKPIEALQVVPTSGQARRASVARLVISGLLLVAGTVLVVMSRQGGTSALVWAILAGFAITIAVLGGAPLYIAPLLKLIGRAFGWAGPTTRLAFANAARNPRRAASTATALMLAVGLIVTLQVALATVRTSGTEAIARQYPIDVQVTFAKDAPAGIAADLAKVTGVAHVGEVQAKELKGQEEGQVAFAYAPASAYAAIDVEPPATSMPADKSVVTSTFSAIVPDGATTVTLPGVHGSVTLDVVRSNNVDSDRIAVSPSTLAQLNGKQVVNEIWVQLTDRQSSAALNSVLGVTAHYPEATVEGGGAIVASLLTQVLNVLLVVLTALLGVAVLIALVGVGNTLGLSVIERQRESALLRALGMQKASLKKMLLVEAAALVGIGTAIGLVAGVFFGWLGVSSAVGMMPAGTMDLRLSIDPWYTIGLIGICFASAVLASLVPGRRAAKATPTEALAVE